MPVVVQIALTVSMIAFHKHLARFLFIKKLERLMAIVRDSTAAGVARNGKNEKNSSD